jgi:hypothetical protein
MQDSRDASDPSRGATLSKFPYGRKDYYGLTGLTARCFYCRKGDAFTMLRAHAYSEHAHKKHKRRAAPSTQQQRRPRSQRSRHDTASTPSCPLFSSTWVKITMTVALHCSVVGLLLFVSTFVTRSAAQDAGTSLDQPNPIAQRYPNVVSGNLNGTTMIVPIPLAMARQLIPYPILDQSYRSLLPSFPADMYPMMVSAKHDHDLQLPAYNVTVPDFTVS